MRHYLARVQSISRVYNGSKADYSGDQHSATLRRLSKSTSKRRASVPAIFQALKTFNSKFEHSSAGDLIWQRILPVLALLTISLVLAPLPAQALDPQKLISQFTHTSWSAKDGIPGPVRAIAQTPDGYLWLGTEAGLYRFDGLNFVLWEPDFGEHLPGSSVWSLCVARDGSLWIGFGSGGISQLRDGHLRNYSPGDGVPGGGIKAIAEDRNGSLWAGGPYGFSRFESGKWRRLGTEEGYAAPGAQSLLVDRLGNLWVATDGFNFGLSRDSVRRNTILTLAPDAKRFAGTGQAVGMVWMMAEAADGNVWITETSAGTVRPITGGAGPEAGIRVDSSFSPTCFLFDGAQSLWIGSLDEGLRRVSDLGQVKNVALDQFQSGDGLSGSDVNTIYNDREGNVWVGTTGGLDRFRENKVIPFSAREGLAADQLALTSTQDGSVWLIGYTHDSVQRFQQGRFFTSKLPPYSRTDSNRILSLYADETGRVWVGGSFKLATEVNGVFSFPAIAEIENGAMVEAVAKDAAGDLWITLVDSNSVPRVLRMQNGKWTDFSKDSALPGFRCRVLYGDRLGRMWLGFENGEVAVYDKGGFHLYSSEHGLPGSRVLAITSDRAGHILLGGEDGLSRFEDGRFRTLTKTNGLPGNSVSGIVEDDDGYLWLAGALGILRISPQELEKALSSSSYIMQGEFFDATSGLRGLPRQREPFPTVARAADGRLWFATTGGVAVIDPRHWHRNIVPPPVMIEAVKADDQSLAASTGLRLQPNTKDIEFHFTALSLSDPERVRFRYKLEGYDTDWHVPVSVRQITYTNLRPGNYRFRVIACNNDGVWNEEGATLGFNIAPAFYQTYWFLLLCGAGVVCLVWLGYRLRVRQVRARLALQFEERLQERTRIAQDLHDTLLQGFLSASMQLHVADDKLPANSLAKPHVSRVLELMGQVIEEGRNAVRGLRSSNGRGSLNLEEAFSRVQQELAVEDEVAFRVIVEGHSQPLHPIIHDEVYRIGHEALVNAFRHSHAKTIKVEVEYSTNHLRLLVSDDGDGIDSQVLRVGREGHWGLSGMRERAERIGARLKVRSRPTAGTEVELVVPSHVAYSINSSGHRLGWFARRRRRKAEE